MKKIKQVKIFTSLLFLLVICIFSFFPLSTHAFAAQAVILLDPGHSSISKGVYDDPYNIYDDDYPNIPEITEVMDVAKWLNQKLSADGYKVIMTKDEWNSPAFVSLWDRAQKANNNNVDLAVSIHDDHSQSWSNFAQVYIQQPDEYRVDKNGKNVTFNDVAGADASKIAASSKKYGDAIASARTTVEGHTVTDNVPVNFAGRAPLAAGNITQVQLYSKVPWVYNEVGGQGIDINKYEQGLLKGIEAAISPTGGSGGAGGGPGNGASNCVITKVGNPKGQPVLPSACTGGPSAEVQSVIAFARAHLKNGTYISGKPDRTWANDKPSANSPSEFDCSGFVGWAWYWGSNGRIKMGGQTTYDWANLGHNKNYQKVVTSSTAQMQPGDAVYFDNGMGGAQPGHVGLFVGRDTCGADDCFMEYFLTGHPGDEESIKASGAKVMGYIRMNP